MALFSRRIKGTSRRALRKARTKELKARAKAERKFLVKSRRKAAKQQAKAERKAPAPRTVTADPTGKAAKKAEHRGGAAKVGTYLSIARVVGPVVAPFAYRAASAVRGQVDGARARKIGVGVEQLSEFTGHGAALSAQIAGLEPALDELVRVRSDAESAAFRERTVARLAELSTAVHAAERMPTARRKAAHRSVAVDLDRMDAELLERLGVR